MLDDLPCSLNEPRDATGAYLVFWWNGAPLGHAVVHAGEFPLNEADLQRRALRDRSGSRLLLVRKRFQASLASITTNPRLRSSGHARIAGCSRAAAEESGVRTPKSEPGCPISAIVCTRGRPEVLRRCLATLLKLDPAAAEIIVVDNAPEEGCIVDVVEEFDGVIY